MLPEMTGEEVCRQLKADPDTAAIPVLMLTAKGQPAERIAGLEIGADDYLTQALQPARTRPANRGRAAARARGRANATTKRTIDDFVIDRGNVRDHARRPAAGPDDHRVQAALRAAGAPGPGAVARDRCWKKSGATRARWTRARSIHTSAACARSSARTPPASRPCAARVIVSRRPRPPRINAHAMESAGGSRPPGAMANRSPPQAA